MSIYDVNGDIVKSETNTDPTLTIENMAADAKATGTAIRSFDLPRIFISGTLPTDKGQGELPVTLTFKSRTMNFTAYATLKVQGDSSALYDKKNFTIKLYSDQNKTIKKKVKFGNWKAYNKYVVKANWIDITHTRNVVGAKIWGDMVRSRSDFNDLPTRLKKSDNMGAIDGFQVVMYVNGVYYGRYDFNISKDNMLNMDDSNPGHAMVQGQKATDAGCKFRSTSTEFWSDEFTDDLTHVETRWVEVLTFVSTASDNNFKANLGNYFSVPSLIDFYLLGTAFFSYDSYVKNQSYLTYDGNYFICSAYDLDGILGVFWTGTMPFNPVDPWYPELRILFTDSMTGEYSGFESGTANYLYERLANLFSTEIKARWQVLRSPGNALSYENVIGRFEEWYSLTSDEMKAEDYAVTTAGGAFVSMGEIAGGNIETNNIWQIRDFIKKRLDFLDTQLI